MKTKYVKLNSLLYVNKNTTTRTGHILNKVGEVEKRLGQFEKDFVQKSSDCLLQPLKSFLDGQMKTIQVRHFYITFLYLCR